MGRYIVQRELVSSPTAGSDILTLVSGSNRAIRIVEVSVAGRGTSSAAQQIVVATSSSGTTGGGAIVPTKFDDVDQPAANTVVNTTWSGQPTLDTNGEVLGWNSLGGANRWIPPGGSGLKARNGAYISIRASASVTFQPCSISVIFEEI